MAYAISLAVGENYCAMYLSVWEYNFRARGFYEKHGFVNRVFADKTEMLAGVTQIAELIASKSPLSVRGTKRNVLFARDHSVAESLEYIANWNAAMFYSNDLQAAFQATVMKQTPQYVD